MLIFVDSQSMSNRSCDIHLTVLFSPFLRHPRPKVTSSVNSMYLVSYLLSIDLSCVSARVTSIPIISVFFPRISKRFQRFCFSYAILKLLFQLCKVSLQLNRFSPSSDDEATLNFQMADDNAETFEQLLKAKMDLPTKNNISAVCNLTRLNLCFRTRLMQIPNFCR